MKICEICKAKMFRTTKNYKPIYKCSLCGSLSSKNNICMKTLKITQKENKEGLETNIRIEGFTEFEVIGMLSYYLDVWKIKMIRAGGIPELKKD
jgi:DNA-directed RNA polymerase subunit M/transcription elongation factor TFIIS